jgi:hypothetical protein
MLPGAEEVVQSLLPIARQHNLVQNFALLESTPRQLRIVRIVLNQQYDP